MTLCECRKCGHFDPTTAPQGKCKAYGKQTLSWLGCTEHYLPTGA